MNRNVVIIVSSVTLFVVLLIGCGMRKKNAATTNNVATPNAPGDDQPRLKPGDYPEEQVTVGNATRTYRLVVPESAKPGEPLPLVVAFHGMLIDSKDVMPQYAKLSDTARKHGFAIAYPEAIGKSWGLAPDKVKNDLAFFDALVTKVSRDVRIDPKRVYVVGMSNGGYFAHLVARERSHTVAACAAHSGPLGLQTLLGVNAERKFPVLIAHGDRDPIFNIAIARENRDKYQREGHTVKYVEIPQLGHFWGTDVNINETIWQFFAAQPLR